MSHSAVKVTVTINNVDIEKIFTMVYEKKLWTIKDADGNVISTSTSRYDQCKKIANQIMYHTNPINNRR